jgi:cystathionine gamma-synthase
VVSGRADLIERIAWHRDTTGPIADARVAELLNRGLHTLELRMKRLNDSAQRIAEFLEGHARVQRVLYTGLESHPHRDLAKKYLVGHGGVVTFDLNLSRQATADFVDSLSLPFMASNFGAPQTLIEQSSFFTYFEYSDEELARIGVTHGTVRLAVGYLDDPGDIINDLNRSLTGLT